jgi:DNA repair protein RadC
MPNTTQSAPTARAKALSSTRIPGFVAEKPGRYRAKDALTEAQIINAAMTLVRRQVQQRQAFTNPTITQLFLKDRFGHKEHEEFAVLFLDNQNRLIRFEVMFRGTIDATAVYPREIAKSCLKLNAAAVIVAHNHPSGITQPSAADKQITAKLKQALDLIDVRLLDHFIIGVGEPVSLANLGLI